MTPRRTWRRCREHCCGDGDRRGSHGDLEEARSSRMQHEVDDWTCEQAQVLAVSSCTLHSMVCMRNSVRTGHR